MSSLTDAYLAEFDRALGFDRIADRMKGWDGRYPIAMDGSDLFGALGCLPKLLAALVDLGEKP